MSLVEKMKLPSKRVLDEDYYVLIESHLDYLKKHPLTKAVSVSERIAAMYQGDFHGLLNYLGLDKKLHYLITRMNGHYSSSDFSSQENYLVIPDPSTVASIIATFSSEES